MENIPCTNEMIRERLHALAQAFPWPTQVPPIEPPREHLGWLDEGVQRLLAQELSTDTRFVVELGTWLGLSTRFLADCAPNAVVAAVDHWQGSPEHHTNPEWRVMLPALYENFLALCWAYRERIIPLRRTTLAGLQLVADYGLSPDLIYVDAEHSYEAVLSELELSNRLFPRAILVGDDYPYPPVRAAVAEFTRRHSLQIQKTGNGWKVARKERRDRESYGT